MNRVNFSINMDKITDEQKLVCEKILDEFDRNEISNILFVATCRGHLPLFLECIIRLTNLDFTEQLQTKPFSPVTSEKIIRDIDFFISKGADIHLAEKYILDIERLDLLKYLWKLGFRNDKLFNYMTIMKDIINVGDYYREIYPDNKV